MTGLPKKQAYVKLTSFISGTTDLYFATGNLVSAPANTYNILTLESLGRGKQTVNPITGTTQFPSYTFTITDPLPKFVGGSFVSATLGRATYLLNQNKTYLPGCRATVFVGDDATAYSSFEQVFDGYLSAWPRIEGGYSFEIMPRLKNMERPINFPTGSFQIRSAISHSLTKGITYKNGMNVDPGTRTNLLSGSTAWTLTGLTGTPGTVLTNPTGGAANGYTDISLGSSSANVKYGTCYTFYVRYSANNGATVQVKIDAYNGATLLETVVSDLDAVSTIIDYVGVCYLITNPATTKLRITVLSDDTGSAGTTTLTCSFVESYIWQMGRELVDIISTDTTGTNATMKLAGRGQLGSLPTAHDAGEEAVRVTAIGGHPFDVFQRFALTTSSAGTNGSYDAGDSYGVGAELSASNVDSTTINSERDATDSGTAFSGYNSGAYRTLFLFDQKIPNFLEFAFKELMQPFHANLFMNKSGQVSVHLWRSTETAGSSSFTDSNVVIAQGSVELLPEYDTENTVNRIVVRMDHDLLSCTDIKGDQSGGRNNYTREWVFDETSFGEDSTTASSKALLGVRELVIESRGLRGSHSRRFGYCNNLAGDQTAFEVARRIATRHRWPLPIIQQMDAAFSMRNVEVGDIAKLTFTNIVDVKAGAWGRTNSKIAIEGKTGPEYGDENRTASFDVRIIEDIDAIPNTTTDAAATTPADADFTSVRKRKTLTELEKDDLKVYPKGYANTVYVTMAATKTFDRLVYAAPVNAAGGAYPGDSYLQCVGEIPAGSTFMYFLAIGNSSGNTEVYVKVSARNADRVETGYNPTAQRAQSWNGSAWANGVDTAPLMQINRGQKAEINQIANDGRVAVQTNPFTR